MYRLDRLPIGCDLKIDIKYKIKLPVNVLFDIGANTGQTVKRFKKDFPQAQIYSFEPVSDTFHQLKKNTKHLPKVQTFPLALGERNCQMEIKTYTGKQSLLNSLNLVSMNQEGKSESITVNTGDHFCQQNQIDSIDLLKIDTEGYELQVLHGFAGMMDASKIKAIYCEVGFNQENKRNTYFNDVLELVGQYGFQFYGLYDIYNKHLVSGSDYGSVLFVRG
jgi:FkbM family methyltransferase